MGLGDWLSSLFGGKGDKASGASFGGLNPDDVDGFVQAKDEISDAERAGEAEHRATLAKYGFRDADAWDAARSAFDVRHRTNWYAICAPSRFTVINGLKSKAHMYEFPMALFDPIEGVTLEQRALIQAQVAAGTDLATAAGQQGMDPATYARADAAWSQRMASGDVIVDNTLGGLWHTYQTMAQGFVQRGGSAF